MVANGHLGLARGDTGEMANKLYWAHVTSTVSQHPSGCPYGITQMEEDEKFGVLLNIQYRCISRLLPGFWSLTVDHQLNFRWLPLAVSGWWNETTGH